MRGHLVLLIPSVRICSPLSPKSFKPKYLNSSSRSKAAELRISGRSIRAKSA